MTHRIGQSVSTLALGFVLATSALSGPLAGMAHSEAHYFNRWAFLLHDSQHHLAGRLKDYLLTIGLVLQLQPPWSVTGALPTYAGQLY